jgi:hypothetical protein
MKYLEDLTVEAKEAGEFNLIATSSDGSTLWSETAHNALADEGEQQMLDVYLRGATAPTGFTIRLFNDTPVETDTVADLTGEPSGAGYAAQTIEKSAVGWPSLVLDSGDYLATSKTVTFTASGGPIGPVTYACLVSSDSKLISYAALSQSRTLADGESLMITYRVKQQ